MKEQQMAVIVYENISKTFDGGKTYAVDGVSAEIEKGEFVTILGSSGCGKTTLLKLTNRLYEPDGGRILVEGKDTSGLDPVRLRRSMGYVIQQVGLFPHMTVEGNITAVPSLMKWDKGRMKERADQLLRLVGLEPSEFRDRYPHQLSGGQQHKELGKTVLFVTHDIDEAFRLGDRVMVMNEGKILQFGKPSEIAKEPADGFVRSLIESARSKETFWTDNQ